MLNCTYWTLHFGTVPDESGNPEFRQLLSCIFTFLADVVHCPVLLQCYDVSVASFFIWSLSYTRVELPAFIPTFFYRSTTAIAASCLTAVSQHSMQHRSTISLCSSIMQHRSTIPRRPSSMVLNRLWARRPRSRCSCSPSFLGMWWLSIDDGNRRDLWSLILFDLSVGSVTSCMFHWLSPAPYRSMSISPTVGNNLSVISSVLSYSVLSFPFPMINHPHC